MVSLKKIGLIAMLGAVGSISFFAYMLSSMQYTHGVSRFGGTDEILTNNRDDVIGSSIRDSSDSFRDGTKIIGQGIGDADDNDKIYFDEIDSTEQSRKRTADFVRALVNYALAILGLVALLYIVYHGFLTVTAAGNDEQAKKGWEGLRYGATALLGIATAWFILSLVFWLIQQVG